MVKHLKITGRVQGVGFRYYLNSKARELGVTGWTRNRRDGSVEAMIAGDAAAVMQIIEWAKRGPLGAAVANVEITAAKGSFDRFETLPTE